MKKKPTTSDLGRVNKPAKNQEPVYQFKITLPGTHPLVWRRIQVKDGTLDRLHEYIQTAMGWTNSHLHYFKIGEHLYGDPMLMEDHMEGKDYRDSTTTILSDILPTSGKRFRVVYQYDFGDNWEHEILFQGCRSAESYRRYPVCLDGQRACPPEDVGGTPGYDEFLEAIADTGHQEDDDKVRWVGGTFDPDAFDPIAASKAMRKRIFRA